MGEAGEEMAESEAGSRREDASRRYWDLSQPLYHDCPSWPTHEPPVVTLNHRRAVGGGNVETVTLDTHTGTHVDAPFHFDDAAATIEQMPLEAFAGPALFIDLRDRAEARGAIGPGQLGSGLESLRPGDFAILVTGWGQRRAVTTEYLKEWPYLGGEGARALLERGVAGVGIDALSIGGSGGSEESEPSHLALLGAGKVVIEELCVPEELLGQRRFFTVFPVKLRGCGGAWARAVAWESGPPT